MRTIEISDGITAIVRGKDLTISVRPGSMMRDVAIETVLELYDKAVEGGDIDLIIVKGLNWRAVSSSGSLDSDYFTAVALNNSGFMLNGNDLFLRTTGPSLIRLMKGKKE